WMNIWRTVTIWLCTWDAGHRVTELDLQFAKTIDRIYSRR
ncbi:MAG: 4a-hydroxytetrahydrobiopterin dehydratase, partial [Rhodospirillales bacterium]|nr:4a-hydroxytetrahydrobiopterin dehydratase [Rhodospirillales bacterium]